MNLANIFIKLTYFSVCSRPSSQMPDPLACLDYQYVAALLQHGLNLAPSTEILVCIISFDI